MIAGMDLYRSLALKDDGSLNLERFRIEKERLRDKFEVRKHTIRYAR